MSKKKKYVVVPGDGIACPRCGRPTEIREHDVIRPKHLAQPHYFSRWFYCNTPKCLTKQIVRDEFKVLNDPTAAADQERLEQVRQQLTPIG